MQIHYNIKNVPIINYYVNHKYYNNYDLKFVKSDVMKEWLDKIDYLHNPGISG